MNIPLVVGVEGYAAPFKDDSETLSEVIRPILEEQQVSHKFIELKSKLICGPRRIRKAVEEAVNTGYHDRLIFVGKSMGAQNIYFALKDKKMRKIIETHFPYTNFVCIDAHGSSFFIDGRLKPVGADMGRNLPRLVGVPTLLKTWCIYQRNDPIKGALLEETPTERRYFFAKDEGVTHWNIIHQQVTKNFISQAIHDLA